MLTTMRVKKVIVGVAVLAAPVSVMAQSAEQLIQKYAPLVVSASCDATADNAKALVDGLRDGTKVVMYMEVAAPPPPPPPAFFPGFGVMLDTTSTSKVASIDDSASTGGTTCTTQEVSFEPPTGKMGLGNVDNALTLAQGMLKNINIVAGTASGNEQRNATPADVKAALIGEEVTTPQGTQIVVPGILTLRSQGWGWGEISNHPEVGAKL
jgi:hypothetical protein